MLNDESEEGEINSSPENEGDDSIEPYQALERPAAAAEVVPYRRPQNISSSDEESSSSESSSSSDEGERPAKRRRKVDKRPVVVPAMAAVRRRDVWSSVLLEDRIEQELKEVGVRRGPIDRSRDVESYDYPRPGMMGKVVDDADEDGTEEEEEAAHEEQVRCKLAQLDKRDGGHSLRSAAASDAEKPTEPFEAALQETRQLLTSSRKRKLEATQATDERHQRHRHKQKPALATRVEALSISVDSSDVEVAQDVASKLHEEKMDLILRVVQILGRPAAIRLFEEARQIENHDGGILTADGSRRRTPGGVFLYLLRNDDEVPMEQIRQIFAEENKTREKFKRVVRARRRQAHAHALKQSLQNDLPALPSRTEAMVSKMNPELEDEDQHVVDINFE